MNVIFDMDGLMFDTEKVFIKAWDYAGEKIGIGKAGYMVYKTLGMSIVASYEIWNEEFGDRYNQEELRKYTKEFLKNYYENNKVPVKQGLYVLLEYLKNPNAKLAVASSSPRWEVEKHLNDAGIIDCFSAIICGDISFNSFSVNTLMSPPLKNRDSSDNRSVIKTSHSYSNDLSDSFPNSFLKFFWNSFMS